MLTATERTQTVFQPDETRPSGTGPILVATDGTDSADAALRAAAVLESHSGTDVVAVAVLMGMPIVPADFGMVIPPLDTSFDRRRALTARVRDQLLGLGEMSREWKVEVREGDPAATIARTARELDARVIVVGAGHHDLLDRLLGGETALHTLRQARNPVLAVPAGFNAMPKRIVVATDFSVASVTAARKALELFDTATTVYLVHVAPRLDLQQDAFASWMSIFSEGLPSAFERLKSEIGIPTSVRFETASPTGKPARELLSFAESVNADLIVTGSRGAGLMDRMLVGSTATGLLRGATCAVFAVPTGGVEDRLAFSAAGERVNIHRDEWAQELETFTQRNAGRPASLEVDDPEMGAQSQEHDYPFLGAAWDRNDQRVEIMLGDFEGGGRHLTRGIAGVTGIDLVRDETGRDWVLRVAHAPGQTILAFKR